MILLGINDSHDASACIVINGKLIGAIQEERIKRKKCISSFPKEAIKYLLKEYKINLKDIDQVCIATKQLLPLHLWNIYADFKVDDWLKFENEYYYEKIYNNKNIRLNNVFKNYKLKYKIGYNLKNIPFATSGETSKNILKKINDLRLDTASKFLKISKDKISFHDHHMCHALYGYYTNPFKNKNQVIVTCDGGGDGINTSIIHVKNYKFKIVRRINNNLLAVIYKNITLLLGMLPSRHAYKVMGLEPYSDQKIASKICEIFEKSFYLKNLTFIKNKKMKSNFFYFKKNLENYRFDNIAGGIQMYCEKILTKFFHNIHKATNCSNFVFSGGVANNVKANKILAEQAFISNLWIPPGPGDESISIGAAYDFMYKKYGEKKTFNYIEIPQNAYWGPDINSKDISQFKNNKIVKRYFNHHEDKKFQKTAKALDNGEIVFVCFSRQEFGQRALGHRSIICNPSNLESVKKINSTIKMRDFWMPFTPSILDKDANKYVIINKKLNLNYMTVCLDSTDLGKKHLKAAMHPYDNTIRPQIVTKKNCSSYYELINAFKKISGIGAVLNTSLNMHEYPIVNKPIDIINEIILKNKKPNFNVLIENNFFQLK